MAPNKNKTIPISSHVLALAFHLQIINAQFCLSSVCHWGDVAVRFPFRITNQNLQPKSCGYPGFDLTCDATTNTSQTILNLPNSGKFSVQAIDYDTQEILINDPNSCLPKQLLSFNLSNSPFRGVYYQDFSFYNCTFGFTINRLNPIACLSGPNYRVFATSSRRARTFLSSVCRPVADIKAPVPWPLVDHALSSDLTHDLRLVWDSPHCGKCEAQGQSCGFKGKSTLEVECKAASRRGSLPGSARYAITVGVGIPAVLGAIGLLYFIYGRIKLQPRQSLPTTDLTSTVNGQPTITTGLDGLTIESYPKRVLVDVRRLPNPEDNTCPICLSEYKPKDTLKTIPQCQHSFHEDCIDVWLRLNATCPVCRNSQLKSPLAVQSSDP